MVKRNNVWIIPVPPRHDSTTTTMEHDMQVLAASLAAQGLLTTPKKCMKFCSITA